MVLAADHQGRIDQGHQHMRVPDRVPDRMPEGQGMGTPHPLGMGMAPGMGTPTPWLAWLPGWHPTSGRGSGTPPPGWLYFEHEVGEPGC